LAEYANIYWTVRFHGDHVLRRLVVTIPILPEQFCGSSAKCVSGIFLYGLGQHLRYRLTKLRCIENIHSSH
jgi:hypothetical protein